MARGRPGARAASRSKPASLAALTRRAKAGDADALAELVERADTRGPTVSTSAVKAIAAVGGPAAWAQLAALMGASRNRGVTYAASRMLDRAVSKHPAALEYLIRACEHPAIDDDVVGLASLSDQIDAGKLHDEPRVVKIFRRALTAANPYAQGHAVMALARIGDVRSRPGIVALLGQQKRSDELFAVIGAALVRLGGGEPELRALERARVRARPGEKGGLDKAIATLTRLVAAPVAPRTP